MSTCGRRSAQFLEWCFLAYCALLASLSILLEDLRLALILGSTSLILLSILQGEDC